MVLPNTAVLGNSQAGRGSDGSDMNHLRKSGGVDWSPNALALDVQRLQSYRVSDQQVVGAGGAEELRFDMENERRVKSRYPIELNVRYQTMGTVSLVAGVGQTVNISSSGMLVACRSNVSEGTRLKAIVEWPSLLNGTTPLQLITMGTVVRRDEVGLCIAFDTYQFRTMGRARPSNVTQMPERISSGSFGSAQPQPLSLIAKSSS